VTAIASWPARAELWLDDHGKPAWIAAMVLGFILFWPVGLALLFYMIWGKKMFGSKCATRGVNTMHMGGFQSSGNSAFDAYKLDTLKRLEDEQAAFGAFLDRLREAKDKTEFDAFMDDRARKRRDEAEKRADA
jgi:hypothetical protein